MAKMKCKTFLSARLTKSIQKVFVLLLLGVVDLYRVQGLQRIIIIMGSDLIFIRIVLFQVVS